MEILVLAIFGYEIYQVVKKGNTKKNKITKNSINNGKDDKCMICGKNAEGLLIEHMNKKKIYQNKSNIKYLF